ncbi:uncharacterized protein LOC119687518 isoform X2 [Teleopsis dalmanni]|uniref:uncharacterized protein LOC119687518 isoform X2 n=1 Tax=Teleopsis dalmanni TaxID=139649 RepID=UPI0018CF61D4|nr:uncharacterized protein LOC119687518 isoform X2 [Teleopsis dalmanni]
MSHHSPLPSGEGMEQKTILSSPETGEKMEKRGLANNPVNEGNTESNKLKGSAFCNFRDTIIISSCGSGLSNESTGPENDILSERFNAAAPVRIKTENNMSINSSPKNEQQVNSSVNIDNDSDIIVVDVEDEKINIIDSESPAVVNMESQNIGASENLDTSAAIEISSSNYNSLRKFSPYRTGMSISISQRKPIERANKSRTDSTGDFPVSDSSCQGKRKRRLSTDLFEFRLIQLEHLRLNIRDKIEAWNSSDVVSDIEDVINFDKDFEKYEVERRKLIETGSMPTDLKDFRLYSTTINDKSNLQDNNPELPSTSGVTKRQKLLQEANDYRARLQETGHCGKPSSYEDSTSTEGRAQFARKKRTNVQFITQVNENGKHPAIKENTIEDKNAKKYTNTNTTPADNCNKCDNNIALVSKPTGLNNNTKRLIETFWDFTKFKENFNLKEHADQLFKSRKGSNSNDFSGSESNHKDSNSDDSTADYSNELSTSLSNEHQQQEFYTYLGLTDTSNMNAITSASAELATSHLQRRSLRVRRMQLDKEKNMTKDKKSYKIARPNKSRIKKAKDKQKKEKNKKTPTVPKPFNIPNNREAKIKIEYHFSSNDNTDNSKSHSTTPLTIPHLESEQKIVRKSTPESSTCPRSSFSDRGGGSIKSEYYRVQNGYRLLVTPPFPTTKKIKLFPRPLQCCQGDCSGYLPNMNNVTLRNSILPISQNISLKNSRLLYQVQRRAVFSRTPETSCTPSSLQPIQKNDVMSEGLDESSSTQNSTINLNNTPVKKFTALDFERSIDLLQKIIPHEQTYNCSELLDKVQAKYRLLVASVQNQESRSIIVDQFSSTKEVHTDPKAISDINKTEIGTQTVIPSQQSLSNSPPPIEIPSISAAITHEIPKANTTDSPTSTKSKTNLVNGVVSKRNPRARLSKLMTSGHFRLSLQKTLRSRKVIILHKLRKNKKNKNKKPVEETLIATSKMIERSSRVSGRNSPENKSINNIHKETANATILLPDELPTAIEVDTSQAVVQSTDDNVVELLNGDTDNSIEMTINNNVITKADELMISKDSFISSDIIVETKDIATQCENCEPELPVKYITRPPPDPKIDINNEKGKILHIFFESDVLVVVQEILVSFWKYSKLVNTLVDSVDILQNVNQQQLQTTDNIETQSVPNYTNTSNTSNAATSFEEINWLRLGCSNRTVNDTEVKTVVSNRICTTITNNTMYLELHGKGIESSYRTCDLVCMYIKIYFYSDEFDSVGVHQINLDTLQSRFDDITYTCIPGSGYFLVSWYQQNVAGKNRSGICKYAVSPLMDSLASIRDFKNINYKILQLQCLNEQLVGFGKTVVTIWNHRSGDTLFNYDLNLNLGFNLGVLCFMHTERDNNRMFVLLQHLLNDEDKPELLIIACTLSESNPTHRILKRLPLSEEDFDCITNASKTSEYIIVQGKSNAELWINCLNPNMLVWVPAPKNAHRFYRNGQKQVIQFNGENLVVDTIANLMLKLATSFDAIQV